MKPRIFKTQAGAMSFVTSQQAMGHAWHLIILHDDKPGCTRDRCVCNPWYAVEPLSAEGLIRHGKATAEWERQGLS